MGVILDNFKNCERAGLKSGVLGDFRGQWILAEDVERYLQALEVVKVAKDYYESERTVAIPKVGTHAPESGTMEFFKVSDSDLDKYFDRNTFKDLEGMRVISIAKANRLLRERGTVVSVGKRKSATLGQIWYADEDLGHSSSRGYHGLLVNIHPYEKPDSWESIGKDLANRWNGENLLANTFVDLVERAKMLLAKDQEPK